MITLPGFLKNVFEITKDEFKEPEKKLVTSFGKQSLMYTAPSSSILLVVGKRTIELVIGRQVTDRTLQNMLGYGLKNKKPLKILRCELLNNLQTVDQMITLCNKILEQTDTTIEELVEDLGSVEDEEETPT